VALTGHELLALPAPKHGKASTLNDGGGELLRLSRLVGEAGALCAVTGTVQCSLELPLAARGGAGGGGSDGGGGGGGGGGNEGGLESKSQSPPGGPAEDAGKGVEERLAERRELLQVGAYLGQ
jgi:hypothetical protein